MKTFSAKPLEVKRDWYVVDAADKILGRLASEIALRLRGKHKPEYTPHVDTGDYIIVINAEKLRLSGEKAGKKMYYRHTGYPGGLKEIPYRRLMAKKSDFAFREAVRRMLPKGPLGYAMAKKLFVYTGAEHKHEAQKPEALKL